MSKIVDKSCIDIPSDFSDLLGGTEEGALNTGTAGASSGLAGDNVVESTAEQVLFKVNLTEEGALGAAASVVGGCGASGDLASQPRIKGESAKFPWVHTTAHGLSPYLGTSLLRHIGSDSTAEIQVSECGSFVTWVVSINRMFMTFVISTLLKW
jgi:hypothetical protein